MENKLTHLTLRGFKSIRSLDDFEIHPINVLIGANGSGKSNLIAFFRMLSWMLGGRNLQTHIAEVGGAASILHDGPKQTPQIESTIGLETPFGRNDYSFRLGHAAQDTLIFLEEKYRFSDRRFSSLAPWVDLEVGTRESSLHRGYEMGDKTASVTLSFLKKCKVHQFHDTSSQSRIRQTWSVDEAVYLKEDGANLASFLFRLRQDHQSCYHRIVETIRLVAPFLDDFEFSPRNGRLLLQWRERGSDLIFGSHQASDGTLRAMALIALLLQPEEDLPMVLIVDEPELGLHPSALEVVAGLIRSVSHHCQVILATQSTNFLDHFEPEEIVVVDRIDRDSTFRRLSEEDLKEWLADYSLSELWEKNVLGGKPA